MNKYCGPFVLAHVLGTNPDEAARLIRKYSGQRAVRSTNALHLVQALRDTVGIKAEIARPGMTLRTWAEARMRWNDSDTWIVLVTRHYIVWRGGEVIDNGYAKHVDVTRKRVVRAWCVGKVAA